MKKIKKILIILSLTLLLTTGCTKSFRDEKTKNVYTENILCKPTNEESIKAYENNDNVDLDKLPKCEDLKVNSGGYEGLWTSLLVKPLAWVIVKVGLLVKNYGLSIIILGILLRLLVLPLTKQTLNMSEGMKKANPELQRLEKKYAGKNVLVVTHAGVSIYVRCYFEGEPKDGNYNNYKLKNCEVLEYDNNTRKKDKVIEDDFER